MTPLKIETAPQFSTKFLKSIDIAHFSPQELKLNSNTIIIVLRSIDAKKKHIDFAMEQS